MGLKWFIVQKIALGYVDPSFLKFSINSLHVILASSSSPTHWPNIEVSCQLYTLPTPSLLLQIDNFFQIIFHDINSTLSWSHKSPMFLKHLMYSSCALKIDMPKIPFQNFLNHQMLIIMIELAFVSDLNVNILIIIFHACIIWPIF